MEKVIVGGFDENGAKDPQKISFVYKTGFKDDLNGRKFRSPRKVRVDKKTGIKGISSSSKSSEFEKLCYSDEDNTRGDSNSTMSEISRKYTEIVCFSLVLPHFRFIEDKDGYNKRCSFGIGK